MELSAKNLFAELQKHKESLNPFAVVCQCRHETSFQGQPWNSELCKMANNLAGLKKWSGWAGEIYEKVSWEQKPDGSKHEKLSPFCKYPTIESFVANYAKKIAEDYPLSSKSADNFWGYFSGLFKGRVGAWATDLSYLDRLINQVLVLAPALLGDDWQVRCWTALDYAVAHNRLLPGHETRIRERLQKAIPQKGTPGKLVCLDAGHGHPDPGACGNGLKEADINLHVVRKTKEALERRGLRVILTRDGPNRFEQKTDNAAKNRDLNKRPQVANDAGANCFVSVHCNAAVSALACGWEIYTTPGHNNSDKLATSIHDSWKAKMGGVIRADYSDGDPDKEARYAVIVGTKCPSCLIELGFISNPQDAALLRDSAWQTKAAEAIAVGVLTWINQA